MFFAPKDSLSYTQYQHQVLVENANRSLFLYAQSRLRAGDAREAARLCHQLRSRSQEQGDMLHYHAAGRLLNTLNSCYCDEPTSKNRAAVESSECRLQERLGTAIACYLREEYREARTILEGICDAIGSKKNLTIYTASVFSWLASAIRNEWLRTPRTLISTAYELERKWKKTIAHAVKVAGRFEDEKPHACREYAWYSAIHDGPHHANYVLWALRYSVTVAQRLGMVHEEKQTLQDWYTLANDLELNVPSMEPSELARWNELCPASQPTCNHSLHPENCTCASETDIELEVEELRHVMSAALDLAVADREPVFS